MNVLRTLILEQLTIFFELPEQKSQGLSPQIQSQCSRGFCYSVVPVELTTELSGAETPGEPPLPELREAPPSESHTAPVPSAGAVSLCGLLDHDGGLTFSQLHPLRRRCHEYHTGQLATRCERRKSCLHLKGEAPI